MINKVKGEFCCTCEMCGHQEFGGVLDDFKEFVEQIKSHGWTFEKDEDDKWVHSCQECSA